MVSLFNLILATFNTLTTVVFSMLFFNIFFDKKITSCNHVVSIFVYYIWQVILIFNALNMLIVLIVNTILILWLSISKYEGNKYLKTGYSFLLVLIFALSELSVAYILYLLFSENHSEYVGLLVSKILSLLIIYMLRYFMKNDTKDPYINQYSWILIVSPVLSLGLINILFYYGLSAFNDTDVILAIVLTIMIIFTNLAILKIYQLLVVAFNNRKKELLFKHQLAMKEEHAKEIASVINEIRKLRHDSKQYFSSIINYLENNQISELNIFLQEVLEESTAMLGHINTGNITIDSIIDAKYSKISKLQIPFEMDINVPSILPFRSIDLNLIIGNILDNAIEANENVKENDRFLKLCIKYETTCLIINCTNAYNGIILQDNNQNLITVKEDSKNHGFGIDTIKDIIKKYNGSLVLENDNNFFTIKSIVFDLS